MIGEKCQVYTQLDGLAEWVTWIGTSHSVIEVDMPTVCEIEPSEEWATDTSAKDRSKDSSRHNFHHIKENSH